MGNKNIGIELLQQFKNYERFKEEGFVTTPEGYYFLIKNQFIQGTNFTIESLLEGDKRFCKITNDKGRIHKFDFALMSNFGAFKKYLFPLGGFMFCTYNDIGTQHFDEIVYSCKKQFELLEGIRVNGKDIKNKYNKHFFEVIKSLIDQKLISKEDYILTDKANSIKIQDKGYYQNIFKDEILYLNFRPLFVFYKRECLFNEIEIERDVVFSFKEEPFYIGIVAKRFGKETKSCYALNYSAMKKFGIEF